MFLDSKAIAVVTELRATATSHTTYEVVVTLEGVELGRQTYQHNFSLSGNANANEHVWDLCEQMGVDCDLVSGPFVPKSPSGPIAGSWTYTQKPWF